MLTSRRFLFALAGIATLTASLFLVTGCKPKASQPEPFTAQLTEIEGVQAVYTLRHPKLILADLDKLMTQVPETALARMFLGQLTAYGYPEFSEITANTNIGVAMLDLNAEQLANGKPTLVAFAQLKENGKIAALLAQSGLVLEKHGAWTWIAQDAAAFAKIKAPDALTAFIARPQTEELRMWGRASPVLLAELKTKILPELKAKLTARPEAEQNALVAYFDVFWSYLAQLHSGSAALDLNDQGIAFTYSGQFLPDSATGTWLRYAPGPDPKIASSVPADGIMSIAMRQNMPGQITFVSGMLDQLIAVDYPTASELLKKAKASYLAFAQNSDGGAVVTINVPSLKTDLTPELEMLSVYSGKFTEAQVSAFYKDTLALSRTFTDAVLAGASALSPQAPTTQITQDLKENALTIDGVNFGTLTTTTVAGQDQPTVQTQYYGVVAGNLVQAMSEAGLRAKLPALAAKSAVPNPVPATFSNDEILIGAIHGGRIVDLVASSAHLDLADSDIQAQIQSLKQGYVESGPVKMTVSTSQAQASATVLIPYKFIAQSLRLGQFANAHDTPAKPAK